MNLGEIYADHVKGEEKERDPLRLFVSDVGKCTRQVAFRLKETTKDPVSEQTLVNKQIMFDIAEHLESTLWQALTAEGLGLLYQFPVDMYDRVNWGGRGDIIADYFGRRVIEVKSLYPGAFKHDIFYPQHRHQADIYDHYCDEEFQLEASPLLLYLDRGGMNTPVEQEVRMPWERSCALMDEMDAMRTALPEMPEKLEHVLMERSWGKQLVYEPDWKCTRCDYVWTCEQSMSKSVWAERVAKNDPWEAKKAADWDILGKYAAANTVGVFKQYSEV